MMLLMLLIGMMCRWNPKEIFKVEPEGYFLEKPYCILERREISLWTCTIGQEKVQWKHLSLEEATWELEIHMRDAYPILFQGNSEDEE